MEKETDALKMAPSEVPLPESAEPTYSASLDGHKGRIGVGPGKYTLSVNGSTVPLYGGSEPAMRSDDDLPESSMKPGDFTKGYGDVGGLETDISRYLDSEEFMPEITGKGLDAKYPIIHVNIVTGGKGAEPLPSWAWMPYFFNYLGERELPAPTIIAISCNDKPAGIYAPRELLPQAANNLGEDVKGIVLSLVSESDLKLLQE